MAQDTIVPPSDEVVGSGIASAAVPLFNVVATSDPGDTLDAAGASDPRGSEGYRTNPAMNRLSLSAVNTGTAKVTLNVQLGGTGVANRVVVDLPVGAGFVEVLGGPREILAIRGTSVTVWASISGVVNVYFYKEVV